MTAGGVPRGSDGAGEDSRGYRNRASRRMTGRAVVPAYPSRVDLHTHSCRSDGVLEPHALVAAAAAAGVKTLGLTDHDTLAGVRELCAAGAAELPLQLVPGVEINSVATGIDDLWEGELHILGLGVDPDDDAFEAALSRQREGRARRHSMILARLRELGLPVDAESEHLPSEPGSSLGRPQIARLLVRAGHMPSVDSAMRELLARGRPAYVARQGLGPDEAIAAIRGAGGLPALAHFADAPVRRSLITALIDAGLGGLEVHYRRFDAPAVADMTALAAELRLVPTGGSDYHGDGETYAAAHATIFVPDADAVALFAALGAEPLTSPETPTASRSAP